MARTDPRPHYGQKRRVRPDGYVDLFRPGHPLARRDGYVMEHRVVAHDAGWEIQPGFHLHHKNHRRDDNRLANLELIRATEHGRLHSPNTGKTHCKHGHEFTEENTWRSSRGWRYCRTCNRERARRRMGLAARAELVCRPGATT